MRDSDLKLLFREAVEANGDLVLRCTDPDGTIRDLKPVLIEGGQSVTWIQTWDDHDQSHTLEPEAVRNRLKATEPDIRVIPDRRSMFAELREDE